MKGTFRIGGAVLVGVCIILGAFLLSNKNEVVEGKVVVAPAPPRSAIQAEDTDGDGTPDWQEALTRQVFETIPLPTSTAYLVEEDLTGPYAEPTTLTGKFSEAFLEDYLTGKMQGADFSNPEALVGNAITAIENSTQSKKYNRLELVSVPDGAEVLYVYGNTLSQIFIEISAKTENELILMERAISANDPKLLDALVPIEESYEKIIEATLRVPVPAMLIDEHIALLNALESIKTDVDAMQQAFEDPLYSLARVRTYENNARALLSALEALAQVFVTEETNYTKNEPGAFFYLFAS